MMQKSHFPNAYPVNGRMAKLLPCRSIRFDTLFFKEPTFNVLEGCHQLQSIWGRRDVYSSLSNPSGDWELNLHSSRHVRLRCWSRSSARELWESSPCFPEKFCRYEVWWESLTAALLTTNCLLAVIKWHSLVCQELNCGLAAESWVKEVHLCEQGEGLGTWMPQSRHWQRGFNRGKAGDHTRSLEKSSIFLSFCLSMSMRCLSHGHFILDTPIHIWIL